MVHQGLLAPQSLTMSQRKPSQNEQQNNNKNRRRCPLKHGTLLNETTMLLEWAEIYV